jgi:prevent-host-death family protein
MREVGSFEAKTHLPKLIDAVVGGERVVITRRGKPVAMLVPVDEAATAREAVARLRSLRQGLTWAGDDGMSVRDAIEGGRR